MGDQPETKSAQAQSENCEIVMIANWDLWMLRMIVGLTVLVGLGGLLFLILIEIGWLPGGI